MESFKGFDITQQHYDVLKERVDSDKSNKSHYSNVDYDLCTYIEREKYLSVLHCFQNLVIPNKSSRVGNIVYFDDLLKNMKQRVTFGVDKINRPMYFSVSSLSRPIGEDSYDMWNGFQIIDLDIKNDSIADILKEKLFNKLSKYHWFIGITLSSSFNGLHIWTKVKPFTTIHDKRKIEYKANYMHKYSCVYNALVQVFTKTNVYLTTYELIRNPSLYKGDEDVSCDVTKDIIVEKWLDNSMSKPAQGVFVTCDDKFKLSTNFVDTYIDFNFDEVINKGLQSMEQRVSYDLVEYFRLKNWFGELELNPVDVVESGEIHFDKIHGSSKHYVHNDRYKLANTLVSLYGFENALKTMCLLCPNCTKRELEGYCRTARTHNKPINEWAVSELNKYHGFNIKIDNKSKNIQLVDDEIVEVDTNPQSSNVVLEMGDGYLSDINSEIRKHMGSITLLEADAGAGKTEMVKRFSGRTMLILPYRSTIISKIESDLGKLGNWKIYYAKTKVTDDDLIGDCCMAMTLDKFSKLSTFMIKEGNFDNIVIDESHLMFTSNYRPIMKDVLARISILSEDVKILMMSGTPTAEKIFFPNLVHIKVNKNDTRIKRFETKMCEYREEMLDKIADDISESIINGEHILFPTNRGDIFVTSMLSLINNKLFSKHYYREINAFYFKKDNIGSPIMDKINKEKTMEDVDVLFCTTYLSVGVDICDKYNFRVVFCDAFIPQDLEQFANRLRRRDLYVTLYLQKYNNPIENIQIDYTTETPLTLEVPQEDFHFVHNIVQVANSFGGSGKYTPIIDEIIKTKQYLEVNGIDGSYYIDECGFKLDEFNKIYEPCMSQIPTINRFMKYYRYEVITTDCKNVFDDYERQEFNEFLKEKRLYKLKDDTKEIMELLEHIDENNIDIYNEYLRNDEVDIFTSPNRSTERAMYDLYCGDPKLIRKNLNIISVLYKRYDFSEIKSIYNDCIDTKKGIIVVAKLERIKKWVIMETNRINDRLDKYVYRFWKQCYDFVQMNNYVQKEDIDSFIEKCVNEYIATIPDICTDEKRLPIEITKKYKSMFDIFIKKTKQRKSSLYQLVLFDEIYSPKSTFVQIDPFLRKFFGGNITKIAATTSDPSIDNLSVETENKLNAPLPITNKITTSDLNIDQTIGQSFEFDVFYQGHDNNKIFRKNQEYEYNIKKHGLGGVVTTYGTEEEDNEENGLFTKEELSNLAI